MSWDMHKMYADDAPLSADQMQMKSAGSIHSGRSGAANASDKARAVAAQRQADRFLAGFTENDQEQIAQRAHAFAEGRTRQSGLGYVGCASGGVADSLAVPPAAATAAAAAGGGGGASAAEMIRAKLRKVQAPSSVAVAGYVQAHVDDGRSSGSRQQAGRPARSRSRSRAGRRSRSRSRSRSQSHRHRSRSRHRRRAKRDGAGASQRGPEEDVHTPATVASGGACRAIGGSHGKRQHACIG